MKKNILYLLNTTSNEGKGGEMWNKSKHLFPGDNNHPVDILGVDDLTTLIKEKNPDIIGIIGGDGTINRVVSAMLDIPKEKRPVLSIIPFGFGNALSYGLGVDTITKAARVLREQNNTIDMDIFKTNIPDRPFGLFNISIGFDAKIVHHRMKDRYLWGRSYILSAIKSFFVHPQQRLTITVDHSFVLETTATSLSIANCPVIGHNFVLAPNAQLNDGLLDCTLFSSKIAYFSNLRFKGFKHPLYSEEGKVYFKAKKKVQIKGDPYIQIDGDAYYKQKEFEVTVIKNEVRFLCNTKKQVDMNADPFVEKK